MPSPGPVTGGSTNSWLIARAESTQVGVIHITSAGGYLRGLKALWGDTFVLLDLVY